jgi:hypothetical protein
MRIALAAAGLCAVLAAAGCSSGAGSGSSTQGDLLDVPPPAAASSASTDAPAASTTGQSEPTATSAASTPSRTVAFTYTTASGWTYAVDVAVQPLQLAVSKDISSSPPGSARLVYVITGGPTDGEPEIEVPDSNPGRPDGPQLRIDATVAFDMSRAGDAANDSADALYATGRNGPCEVAGGGEFTALIGWPQLECGGGGGGSGGFQPSGEPMTTGDLDESAADAIAAATTGEAGAYILYFRDDDTSGADTGCTLALDTSIWAATPVPIAPHDSPAAADTQDCAKIGPTTVTA